jgi:replication fork protection complex subunit Tof1/Swi1
MDDDLDLDQSLRDSVTGLVSALGGVDYAASGRPYVLGDDALGCLKDLKKWVKLYGTSGKLDALRCIAETNLVSLDICQILGNFRERQENDKVKWRLALNCCNSRRRWLIVVELLVQLTWQIELDPLRTSDPVQYTYETPLKFAQIGYKNAILHHSEHNILRPVIRVALPSLAIPRRERPERDDHIINLMMCFLRNLAEISARTTESSGMDRQKNENSRSETILSFERSDVFNLLAALGAGTADDYEKIDCLILEVLYHLLKGVNVEDLFSTPAEVRSVCASSAALI